MCVMCVYIYIIPSSASPLNVDVIGYRIAVVSPPHKLDRYFYLLFVRELMDFGGLQSTGAFALRIHMRIYTYTYLSYILCAGALSHSALSKYI